MIEQTVSFSLTQQQTVKAAMLASSRKLGVSIQLAMLLGGGAWLAAVALSGSRDSVIYDVVIPLMPALFIIVLLVQYVVVPWNARRHFQQSAALQDEVTVTWDNDGIRLSGVRGLTDFSWSDFHRWSENEKLLLLYHSDALFNVIPKTALSVVQCQSIAAMVSQAGVKKR